MAHERHKPENIHKLLIECSGDPTKTAAEIGCHPSSVNRAIRRGYATRRMEMKAEAALYRLRTMKKLAWESEEKRIQEEEIAEQTAPLTRVEKSENFLASPQLRAHHLPPTEEPQMFMTLVPFSKIQNFQKISDLLGVEIVPL